VHWPPQAEHAIAGCTDDLGRLNVRSFLPLPAKRGEGRGEGP
jgi:hypothetical protein